MMNNFIIDFSPQFSYTVAFILLFLSCIGLPLPEEVVLFVLGYLIFLGQMHWWPAIILSLLGILFGDIVGYFFGFKKGEWLISLIKIKLILLYKLLLLSIHTLSTALSTFTLDKFYVVCYTFPYKYTFN